MTIRKRKSFGSRLPAKAPGDPLLQASVLEIEINDQVFKVRASMSGLTLLRVISAMEGDDESAAAGAMIGFLEKAFLTEDRERGMEYLETAEPTIDLEGLSEIIQYLIGEYTGNSTDPSPSSTSGQERDGSITTVELSETASISPAKNVMASSSPQ